MFLLYSPENVHTSYGYFRTQPHWIPLLQKTSILDTGTSENVQTRYRYFTKRPHLIAVLQKTSTLDTATSENIDTCIFWSYSTIESGLVSVSTLFSAEATLRLCDRFLNCYYYDYDYNYDYDYYDYYDYYC